MPPAPPGQPSSQAFLFSNIAQHLSSASPPLAVQHIILDLFTGMGGLGYALELNGVNLVTHKVLHLMFETDERCCELLSYHRSSASCLLVSEADSTGTSGSRFSAFDHFSKLKVLLLKIHAAHSLKSVLVAGGHPCVGNSRANRAPKGSADPESQKVIIIPLLVTALMSLPIPDLKVLFISFHDRERGHGRE